MRVTCVSQVQDNHEQEKQAFGHGKKVDRQRKCDGSAGKGKW